MANIASHSAGSVYGVMNMGNQIGGTLTASLTPVLANPHRVLSREALKDVVETAQ
jgi:hypothetical protein